MSTQTKETTRFDARLSKEQKALFEKAALLGGYRSLTDFIVLTVQEKAKEIVQERERILASEEDSRIFFDAITSPSRPRPALAAAFDKYNNYMSNINKHE